MPISSSSKTPAAAILDIFIALGMTGSAWMIGKAINAVKTTERFVIIKGFAEQEHPADLVIWPIAHAAVGDDLAEIRQHLDVDKQKITQFLEKRGFNSKEVSTAIPQIIDYQARVILNITAHDIVIPHNLFSPCAAIVWMKPNKRCKHPMN